MNCKYCKEAKNIFGLKNHESYCKMNPERKSKAGENNPMFGKKSNASNQYIKSKKMGLPSPLLGQETRKKISDSKKGEKWTLERKKKHSEKMKKTVLKNPSSYSANNISGRTKIFEYRGFKLKGKWELDVAKWLDSRKIEWTNKITKPFEYFWIGETHYYFPDFYLPKINAYIEVKGYERDRDKQKWKCVDNLIIIKKEEIEQIRKGVYEIPIKYLS